MILPVFVGPVLSFFRVLVHPLALQDQLLQQFPTILRRQVFSNPIIGKAVTKEEPGGTQIHIHLDRPSPMGIFDSRKDPSARFPQVALLSRQLIQEG